MAGTPAAGDANIPVSGEWIDIVVPGSSFSDIFAGMRVRREGTRVRVQQPIGPQHSNQHGVIHGGLLMGVIDQSYYIAAYALGALGDGSAVTLESSTQFIGAGRPELPLDAVVEVMRTTGRMVFLRGVLEQDGELVCSFSGMMRKIGAIAGR
jgi:uncharacterized protein (TIGR00369 family)